jgi:hypothetical protein
MRAFVNLKVTAGTETAKALEGRYRVRRYPTLLVVDATGAEVDRIVGYGDVKSLTADVERILRGEGTLPALRARHEAAPDDMAAALAYARRLMASAPLDARELLEDTSKRLEGKDREVEAGAWVALAAFWAETGDRDRAVALFTRVLDERADTKAAPAAVRGASLFLDEAADPEAGLAFVRKARAAAGQGKPSATLENVAALLHLRAAEGALRRMAEASAGEAEALNAVAWQAFEHRIALEDATGWARKAVEASGRKPHILDTLANLLFASGEVEEAVVVQKEAVGKADDPAVERELEEALARFEAVLRLRAAREKAAADDDEDDDDGEDDDADDDDEDDDEDDEDDDDGPAKPAPTAPK